MSQSNTPTLPIGQLQPNPFQPREKILTEDLEELTSSIRNYGILEPLVIAHTPAGYQIIAGERRWRAAKMAGLTEVPVHIKKTTPKGMLEMAIVENVQRINLSPIERAQAFQQLVRDFGYINSEVAEKIGKSPAYISNSIRLLELPDAIKDGLIGGQITEGHARALGGIKNESRMIDCYKIILKEGASVRRAEELSRRYKKEAKQKISHKGRHLTQDDEQLVEWQKKFRLIFNTESKLKVSRSQRQTRVSITLSGSPQQTQKDLEKIIALAE